MNSKKKRRRTRRATKESYNLRSEVLARCGFKSYREYLKSGLWSAIRDRVLERDSSECQCCFGPATQVHHLSYGDVTIRGDRIDKLVSLCDPCHWAVEFDHKRRKRHFADTQAALLRRQRYFARKYANEATMLSERFG